MEKQLAIIVGAGTLLAAAVGGLGWKTVKSRQESKKQSAEKMEARKEELRARLAAKTPVAAAIVGELIEHPPATTIEAVVEAIIQAEPPQDILKVIEGADGDKVISISRARVVADPVQPDQTPMFWSSFVTKLRRPEVVQLSSADFETRNEELPRGYHKCSVDGVDGVLHVTKSNVSAVLHMGGDEFTGISTSGSRFNGKGLVNLNHEQAKNFLTGR